MTSASQQAIVGGYLQVVAATHSEKGVPAVNVWCDEEGKLKDYPVNRRATAIWYALSPEMAGRDVLSRTVFFTGGADEEGNLLPVPPIVELWREVGKD